MLSKSCNVMITGGAGYVGAVLVPKLLENGYGATVLDLFLYGNDVFGEKANHPRLKIVKGDIRDPAAVKDALDGCEAVIHLACISNDPSFELDPALGKSVNFDAFRPLVRAAKQAGVKRFIYASSSSVYGIKEGVEVTEDLPLEPLTDYSKFKAMCEEVLAEERTAGFVTLTLRPATVCGYSPRQRLDVIVNIFANQAANIGKIKVTGGKQLRPNLHIEDMTDLYLSCLRLPDEAIDGKIFNAGYENLPVSEIAARVKKVFPGVAIETTPTPDNRSYHVSSEKIRRELGFVPRHTIEEAVQDLASAFADGRLPNALSDPRYYNIKTMQDKKLR